MKMLEKKKSKVRKNSCNHFIIVFQTSLESCSEVTFNTLHHKKYFPSGRHRGHYFFIFECINMFNSKFQSNRYWSVKKFFNRYFRIIPKNFNFNVNVPGMVRGNKAQHTKHTTLLRVLP